LHARDLQGRQACLEFINGQALPTLGGQLGFLGDPHFQLPAA
jgi:hypothetical protein